MNSSCACALVFALVAGCGGRVEQSNPEGECDSGASGAIGATVGGSSAAGDPEPSSSTASTPASKPPASAAPQPGSTSVSGTTALPYHDLSDATEWTTLTTSSVNIGTDFNGTAFDGRYIYAAPGRNSPVPRYDTQGDIASPASWTQFDLTRLNATAGGFRGAAFDGRYVYFVPYNHADGSLGGTVTRYDTQSCFTEATSWSTFDVSSLDARATGFLGGEFDGRYLYLVPLGIEGALSGVLARFDTRASLTDRAAWSTFDTRAISPHAEGYYGAAFDGRYLYLSPYADGPGYGSTVTRYDTRGALSDRASWSLFDATTVDPAARGFFGATFDGRYAYFVPYLGGGSTGGRLLRYDTESDYSNPSSWLTLDISALGIAPQGALFDGRYVYLVPGGGRVARLDPQQSFTDPSSWSTFDLTAASPGASGFFGGAFDGQYLYFFPSVGSIGSSIARFNAHARTAMPSSYHGSFF
ncbi:MAG TPA: hypothetical protein VNW92_08230 [Polyangiaceae bacterium]|nr:hypothetical protein [Polyangiaceae bacterium]